MDNPQGITNGDGGQAEQGGVGPASVDGYTATFAQINPEAAASPGFASTSSSSQSSYTSQQSSSGTSFFTTESTHAEPEEKKSYMDVMKEKQQYQAQQFQTTHVPEKTPPPKAPAPKPATKPPVGSPTVKPGGIKPVIKPAGMKPVIKAPAPPIKSPAPSNPGPQTMEALPELDALPELPEMDANAGGFTPVNDAAPEPAFSSVEPENVFVTPAPVAPAFESVTPPAPSIPKPVPAAPVVPVMHVKPATPGPITKPAGAPVVKPPIKPGGVVKPGGVKPVVKPPIKPPMKPQGGPGFQQVQAPAVPVPAPSPVSIMPGVPVAPGPVPTFAAPQAPVISREEHLRSVLHPLFAHLGWQEEKRYALIEELVLLPPDQQDEFLKDLGVDLSSLAPAPAPYPVAPAPVAPVYPSPAPHPVQPPVAIKPPVTQGGVIKPPVKPAIKPAVAPPVKPVKAIGTPGAAGLFAPVDASLGVDNFDVDAFLDSMDDTGIPVPSIPGPVEETGGMKQPLAKLIPTTVEKKTEEDLRREEERLKAASSTDSNLVYLRLLAFEKACNGQKTYKVSELSKMLKDLEIDILVGFIQTLDNDFLLAYDEGKKQVTVNEPAPAEVEFMSREFEKWLRFGRL